MREKKHPEYFAIKGYQCLARLSDEDVAEYLGIKARTYKEKVKGYLDFSPAEGIALAKLLNKTQSELFLT